MRSCHWWSARRIFPRRLTEAKRRRQFFSVGTVARFSVPLSTIENEAVEKTQGGEQILKKFTIKSFALGNVASEFEEFRAIRVAFNRNHTSLCLRRRCRDASV